MKPLHTQVSEYIMNKIQSGEWPVGYMIPPEIKLCEQFGISRPSVRTAMMTLVNEGYLNRVKGKGTFVAKPRRLEGSTIFIESFAEEMHQQGKEIENEVIEFRVMIAEERIRKALNLPKGSSVIKLTRLRYYKDHIDEGSIVLTTSYYTMKYSFLQNYDFSSISVHRAMEQHGFARKRTEKHINVTVLDARSSRLMCVEQKSLALTIDSYVRDNDGDLFEYCESFYPVSRNEFILKISL